MTLREYLRDAEKRYLTQLIAWHPQRSAAAKVAGMNRSAFYRLLHRHSLTERHPGHGNESWRALQ